MKAPLKIVAAALCGMLLGFPVAQADEYFPVNEVFIQLGMGEQELVIYPHDLTLQAGEIYRLVVTNPTETTHVVAAPELEAVALTTDLSVQAGELNKYVIINPGEPTPVVALEASQLGGTELTSDPLEWSEATDYPSESLHTGISIGPGQMMEWYLMPVKEGSYKFGCDDPVHAAFGMHTMIEVIL